MNAGKRKPLAYRMRPLTLNEFVGQERLVSPGKLLYRMIKADKLSSVIFYGPPGTGKTTLAQIIARNTSSHFEKLNAVTAGVADIRRISEETQNMLLNPQGRTVLFIDEIHRFNKAQQDALLPYVENGQIILIGATTENPFFEVNKAIISRSTVFRLEALSPENIIKLVDLAIKDKDRGLGEYNLVLGEGIKEFLGVISAGDARVALNALELAALTTEADSDGSIRITMEIIEDCLQKKSIGFDKSGDAHYDNISAFIKSMRGSDPDAAVFYLARALYAGEDPMFLARRIIICASEDVGMANPAALQVAVAAAEGIRMIGMPEGRILLSQAAVTVAVSPKSNASYLAINSALEDVERIDTGEIPMHIRNAPAKGMKESGYGVNYKYPHDFPGNVVKQQYLPDKIKERVYYNPSGNGSEAKIKNWLDNYRKAVDKFDND